MTEQTTPKGARESLRSIDATPVPPKTGTALALALSVCAWTPSLLGNAWMSSHGGVRVSWWIAGMACTVVLVVAALVLVARQRRVARGWRRAPLMGLGVAGICYAAATAFITWQHPAWWVVVAIAVVSVVVAYAASHAFSDAPDDLGPGRR